MMKEYLMNIPDFICLALVYFAVLLPRWRGSRKGLLLRTVFYVYLCFVLYFTLMPFLLGMPGRMASARVNLIPFLDFLMGHGEAQKELLLNIVMTVPFGVFLPLIYGKNFLRTVGWTLALSVAIEILQFFSGDYRISDVTDVISNTIGGATGYLLFRPFRKALCEDARPAEEIAPRGIPKRDKWTWTVFALQILAKSFLVAYL